MELVTIEVAIHSLLHLGMGSEISNEVRAVAKVESTESDEQFDLNLTPDEIEDLSQAEVNPSHVTYSTNDFDVEGLVAKLLRGDVIIPRFGDRPLGLETQGFQRGFVWNKNQMDRFIESLLLEFPIPSFFFVKQTDKRYLVLDGQQRLETLKSFYEGIHRSIGKDGNEVSEIFSLINVAKVFKGLTYEKLSDTQKRTLDSTFLSSVVVTTDNSFEAQENIYKIFERLNSGGTSLTAHEIRVALFSGEFIRSLDRMNHLETWRVMYGKPNPRLRDQELILRILAFHMEFESYTSPLKSFLNGFAGKYRSFNIDDSAQSELRDLKVATEVFERAASLLNEAVGKAAMRRGTGGGVNSAQTEAIFVGLMRRLSREEISAELVRETYARILANEDFLNSTETGTSAPGSVKLRFDTAISEFNR